MFREDLGVLLLGWIPFSFMQLVQTNASVNNRPHHSLEEFPATAVKLLGVSSSVARGVSVS